MSDLKHKTLNKDRKLKTQIINTFEISANETTMASLCSQEDNSAVLNFKNVESKEPVRNNDSNLWCDLLSDKTTERCNFNENDIGEAENEENIYGNTNGQIIWVEDESDNINKLSNAFWEKSKEEDIKIMICKEYKSSIFDLIRYLISSLPTNSYSINKSASSMVQSIYECYQDKYQELVKFNWYWIRINQLNDQKDTKIEIIEEELKCEKTISAHFDLEKILHSFLSNYKNFWTR